MSTFSVDSLVCERYKILATLGEGGMATVYKAFDNKLLTEVALKVLNSDQLTEDRRVQRFLKEFSILKQVKHPSIVSVFEKHAADNGAPFFSMECISGRSLADKIQSKNSGADLAELQWKIEILKQIAAALSYLHDQGIIYCDLKPANTMVLDTPGVFANAIKLVDFGIARASSEQISEEEAANMIGTSHYMSPEQIRSKKLDARSDIYSFGILAFELLTGTLPYNGETAFNVTASHLVGKAPSVRVLTPVPRALDMMIGVCLEKDPAHRYGSMKDIEKRLAGLSPAAGQKTILKKLAGWFAGSSSSAPSA